MRRHMSSVFSCTSIEAYMYMLRAHLQTLPARLNWVDSLTRTGDALAITSASVFCALGLLYFIKMAMYTKKVVKVSAYFIVWDIAL